MAFSQPWGGGRLFGWSGANLAWRTVCTETPAATAMSSWAGQAVSESVAAMKFIKSMALLTVSVVYIIIDCQGRKKRPRPCRETQHLMEEYDG